MEIHSDHLNDEIWKSPKCVHFSGVFPFKHWNKRKAICVHCCPNFGRNLQGHCVCQLCLRNAGSFVSRAEKQFKDRFLLSNRDELVLSLWIRSDGKIQKVPIQRESWMKSWEKFGNKTWKMFFSVHLFDHSVHFIQKINRCRVENTFCNTFQFIKSAHIHLIPQPAPFFVQVIGRHK